MAGLIDQNMDLTKKIPNPLVGGPAVSQAKSFGYDPTLGTVSLDTDTVSGQLKTILEKDNPYITRARQSAAEAANARGLINTTMGVQAGETAAIDAALPVATADANTFSQQRLLNQAAGNTADQFGAGAANQAGIINAAASNEFGKIGAQTEATKTLQAQKQEGDIALQTLQGTQQTGLQRLQGEQALTRQTQAETAAASLARINNEATSALNLSLQNSKNASAETLAQLDNATRVATSAGANVADITSKASAEINRINTTADIPEDQKRIMVQTVLDNTFSILKLTGSVYGFDLSDNLNFSGTAIRTVNNPPTNLAKTATDIVNYADTYGTTLTPDNARQWMLDNDVTPAQVLAAYPGYEDQVKQFMGW